MSAEIIIWPGETSLDLPLQRILDGAAAADLKPCLVLGKDADGKFYIASTTCDAGALLILLERGKRLLMRRIEQG
jgi:hypothetical protein